VCLCVCVCVCVCVGVCVCVCVRKKREDSRLERNTLIINAIHKGSSRHLDSGVDDVGKIQSVESQTYMYVYIHTCVHVYVFVYVNAQYTYIKSVREI